MTKDFSEWLETDGLGGFAWGTVSGQGTRRYYALLLLAQNPPADRVVLVNGFGDWVVTPRIEKPVEIQALWLNALSIASNFNDRWSQHLQRGKRSTTIVSPTGRGRS